MNTFLIPFLLLACISLLAACSTTRHTTTSTRETVQTVPANPVVIEKKTSVQTETDSEE